MNIEIKPERNQNGNQFQLDVERAISEGMDGRSSTAVSFETSPKARIPSILGINRTETPLVRPVDTTQDMIDQLRASDEGMPEMPDLPQGISKVGK